MSCKSKQIRFYAHPVLFVISCFLFHYSASAQITFQKTLGGPGNENSFSVHQTIDGGYIITGWTGIFGGFYDVFLIKTNSFGDTLWTKTFGGASNERGYSVQQTTDGGYIIAGYTESFGAGVKDVYIIKTDDSGNTIWTRTFGGTGEDVGNSIQQTSDDGYIITGYTYSFGSGYADFYLIKTDVNGDSLWTKTIGGTGGDYGYSVQQTTDGGYIIAGNTNSFGVGDYDGQIIKTDSSGNSLWTKTLGGAAYEYINSIQPTADGGYIIAGETNSFGSGIPDSYLMRTDSSGNSLWTKTYGGTAVDNAYSVQQTTDGGYIIVGNTTSFGAGSYDAYLVKTDSSGNFLWAKAFGGTGDEEGHSVQQTTDGGYIISGFSRSFGAGLQDLYLIKTDANGNSGCSQGNTATIVSSPVTQSTSPLSIISSTAGISSSPATIIGSGSTVTTMCTSVGISEWITEYLFFISPNPATNQFTIALPNNFNELTARISDITGKIIYAARASNMQKINVSTRDFAEGVYLVQIQTEKFIETKKVIVTK